MKNNKDNVHTPKELFTEMQALVAEAQAMMADPEADHATDGIGALHARFDAAQERFHELYAGARKQVVAGAKQADETIRDNPYQSITIAAGVGLLVGLLLGRRGQ